MDERIEKAEVAEIDVDDLAPREENAQHVVGGSEPTNERLRPGEGLQHNENVLAGH